MHPIDITDAVSPYVRTIVAAIKTLVLISLSLFLLFTLLSYAPSDPSFNRAADGDVANAMGAAGAFLADPILQWFGKGFYIVPPIMATAAWRMHFPEGSRAPLCRLLLLVPCLAMACLTLTIFQPSEEWPFYVGYGGFLGDLLKHMFGNIFARLPLLLDMAVGVAILFMFAATLVGCWVAAGFPLSKSRNMFFGAAEAAKFAGKAASGAALASVKLRSAASKRLNAIHAPDATLDGEEDEETEDNDDKKRPGASKNEEKGKRSSPMQIVKERRRKRLELESEREDKKGDPKKKRKTAAKKTKAPNKPPQQMRLPPMALLSNMAAKRKNSVSLSKDRLEEKATQLAQVLEDFGIYGKIIDARPGPVVTLYELEPSPGTKSSRVIGLADDIARSMCALSTRISVVAGRNVLGVEMPNNERETVYLKEILETSNFESEKIKLPLALGKDIGGRPIVTDLSRMPHLLVAGTTGSGKSVAVNAMILSLLYSLKPHECKFIMIDPKMLELSVYEGIPHLLAPVVTEPAKAVTALKWAVREMENRYRLMSNLGVRNIAGYNKRIEEAVRSDEELSRNVQTGFEPDTGEPVYEDVPIEKTPFPFIVVIVDEMADLMLTAGKEIEGSIQRLAQMARAAGIHLVMATQRPSVDVITGVIKANFPTRISFQVTSRIDSRTILGEMGAEQLLGMGDMLYMAGGGRVTRVHGPFVDDDEVLKVVEFLKGQGTPEYIEDVTKEDDVDIAFSEDGGGDLYNQAVQIVIRDKRASTSYIQRQLRIGYNRAADLIDRMEKEGVVSSPGHSGKREVLE